MRTSLSNEFPAIRENNREFCEISAKLARQTSYSHEDSKICGRIPCVAEQGICRVVAGILGNGSGELPSLSVLSAHEALESWMRRVLGRFTEPVSFVHAPSWADFIIATPVFKFSVHTAIL
jgi:hypothetical protein